MRLGTCGSTSQPVRALALTSDQSRSLRLRGGEEFGAHLVGFQLQSRVSARVWEEEGSCTPSPYSVCWAGGIIPREIGLDGVLGLKRGASYCVGS